MAYNLEEKMDMAINLLEENKNIVTNLQLYGGIGVSSLFFHTKIKKHQKYKTIDSMMCTNKARLSRTATDRLQEMSSNNNYKATETLLRIVDEDARAALAPNRTENEQDEAPITKEEMAKEIVDLFQQNGFH